METFPGMESFGLADVLRRAWKTGLQIIGFVQ
jgi:hypothetical protein